MAIGEKVTLEELGGARMHCAVSGCGDVLVDVRRGGHRALQALPLVHAGLVRRASRRRGAAVPPEPGRAIEEIVPYDQRKWFDMHEVIDA